MIKFETSLSNESIGTQGFTTDTPVYVLDIQTVLTSIDRCDKSGDRFLASGWRRHVMVHINTNDHHARKITFCRPLKNQEHFDKE